MVQFLYGAVNEWYCEKVVVAHYFLLCCNFLSSKIDKILDDGERPVFVLNVVFLHQQRLAILTTPDLYGNPIF